MSLYIKVPITTNGIDIGVRANAALPCAGEGRKGGAAEDPS